VSFVGEHCLGVLASTGGLSHLSQTVLSHVAWASYAMLLGRG